MDLSAIAFRPLADADLPMLRAWLAEPHVSEWWGDAQTELALIVEDRGNPAMQHFVFAADGRDAGFIQCYDAEAWDFPIGPLPPGARGIDLFIGEPDMIGMGLGSAVLSAFAERLQMSGVPEIVIDPDPANMRAIRAYEKAGFVRRTVIASKPWGPALIMSRRHA